MAEKWCEIHGHYYHQWCTYCSKQEKRPSLGDLLKIKLAEANQPINEVNKQEKQMNRAELKTVTNDNITVQIMKPVEILVPVLDCFIIWELSNAGKVVAAIKYLRAKQQFPMGLREAKETVELIKELKAPGFPSVNPFRI